ncbi:MAG TPA: AI-2E family transporter [Kofleriaceae bacterium]|nr:AI-2E family transporter [Kofleriaceae bacterium]
MDRSKVEGSNHQGTRAVLCAAAVVIVVAGLKAAATMLLPIIVALFLSLLCIPPMKRLQRHGVPAGVSIALVMAGATILVLLVTAVVGQSVAEFQSEVPVYSERLDAVVADGVIWLQGLGVDVSPTEVSGLIDTGAIMNLAARTASSLLSVLSNVLLVVLTMIFMLAEASGFRRKLALAMGSEDADLSNWLLISERVQKYLAIKAWVSLATAACVLVLCLIVGVDFVLLWALLAFLFNFVPNIGSVIAAVPACLLALLQLGTGPALVLAIGYTGINLIIGNVVEPKVMGRRLGLSTLVVFLSLLFWGWVWGPVGMLLSVPLTVIVKIALEHSDDFRWLSILLGPSDDDPPLPGAAGIISPIQPPLPSD